MTKEPVYRHQHVMLIDDNELDNFINEKVLQSVHFARHIYVHTSGRSALEFLSNLRTLGAPCVQAMPDLIFVDINMPFMDGFQFIEQFRKSYGSADQCRIVVLTSSVNEDDRKKAASLPGNVTFLNKPLSGELLHQL